MSYEKTGTLKGRVMWDRAAMAEVAQVVVARVTHRAMDLGLGSDGASMKGYSTRPIYVSRKAFPRPIGGRPTRPKGLLTKTGRKSRRRGKTVYFRGGYAEYKRNIAGNSRVNLTRTGRLRRSLRPKTVRRLFAVIGLSGTPAVYGTLLDRKRPWIALSPSDRAVLARGVERALKAALARQPGGAR